MCVLLFPVLQGNAISVNKSTLTSASHQDRALNVSTHFLFLPPWSINSQQIQVNVQSGVPPHLADDLNQNDSKINTLIDTHYT